MNPEKEQIVEEEGKDGGVANETTNSGSNKHPAQSEDDDEEEDEPVYIESSPCSRWQKRRETVGDILLSDQSRDFRCFSVAQRDIPSIDASYLAMDTEEGVEVVWNEVLFSERKICDSQHNKVSEVFDKLIELNHMNIVKFHGYWQDRTKNDDRPRVVFITEFMSSGSLKTLLRKTKKTKQNLSKNSWRRWCIQLLSALNYLHSCEEPIIHGNLTCDTVFIQNNGLIKIGSIHYPQLKVLADLGMVAPDVLHRHVKSISDASAKNLHFLAPEVDTGLLKETIERICTFFFIEESEPITTAVDIFSLGMVTLEMINIELGGNGDTHAVTDETISEAIKILDNPYQKDLVLQCLESDPSKRPTARELLFHPALFEIPTLKLLSVHSLSDDIRSKPDRSFASPFHHSKDRIFAEVEATREGSKPVIFTYKDCPSFDLDKLLEDVQNGLYPITAYHLLFPTHSTLSLLTKSSILDKVLTASSSYSSFPSSTLTNNDNEAIISIQSTTDPLVFYPIHSNDSNGTSIMTNGIRARNANPTYERSTSVLSVPEHHPVDSTSTIINSNSSPSSTNQEEKENRRILDIQSKIKSKETGSYLLFISVKFQDRLQRDMTAEIELDETPSSIAKELLELGLVHRDDYLRVEQSIDKALHMTTNSPDPINGMSTSLLDVKKTAIVAATAALITAQAIQNQFNASSSAPNERLIDGNTNASTRTNSPPVMFLPT